ncbi:MAG: hypothetical protein JWQ16_2471 [Novosphingobium sp.]|nr:hypothetical protein [Novosphingobium sp.]
MSASHAHLPQPDLRRSTALRSLAPKLRTSRRHSRSTRPASFYAGGDGVRDCGASGLDFHSNSLGRASRSVSEMTRRNISGAGR